MNSAHELGTLIDALRDLRHGSCPAAALTTLVRTHGSTFRRVGTRMLVFDDGSVVCELSGGCPQRDIVLQAQAVIASGIPRMVSYNSESGLDVLMEMGCGGELDVLMEPVAGPHAIDFADTLAQCLLERRHAYMATLFAVNDVIVLPKRLIWNAGDVRLRNDDIGDAALSDAIVATVGEDIERPAFTRRLPWSRGTADVLIESITPVHSLVAIGSSATAHALLPLAAALGWQITLVDQDPRRLQASHDLHGLSTVCASPATIRDALSLDVHSSVVVMTHNLEQDMAYLAALSEAPLAYLGALGSRERVNRMRENAVLDGLQLHAPAGLDIGSETPQEIALAVAAEIVAVINGRSGSSLRDNQGAIH
ncbi:XdhC family protein [Rhodanobacter sp. Col0626]|uniref:XdhC family protein n=1 Tax=Rhodanobacter sp. Col0626 TaxID=3415679 RepID=UPI003CEB66CF